MIFIIHFFTVDINELQDIVRIDEVFGGQRDVRRSQSKQTNNRRRAPSKVDNRPVTPPRKRYRGAPQTIRDDEYAEDDGDDYEPVVYADEYDDDDDSDYYQQPRRGGGGKKGTRPRRPYNHRRRQYYGRPRVYGQKRQFGRRGITNLIFVCVISFSLIGRRVYHIHKRRPYYGRPQQSIDENSIDDNTLWPIADQEQQPKQQSASPPLQSGSVRSSTQEDQQQAPPGIYVSNWRTIHIVDFS